MRGTVSSGVPVSVEGADLVVSALERDLLADPVTVDGISISRSDLADMVGSLTDRRADGRSVFLLQGAETPEEEAEMERSEEHTSELQSLMRISYAVFCLKKKKTKKTNKNK